MKDTERAVISVGTVSRALNNDIRIASDVPDRVSIVICELGCAPNLVKGMVDGLLLISLSNPANYIDTLTNTTFHLFQSITKAPAASVRLSARGMECRVKNPVQLIMPAIAYPFALEEMWSSRACRIYVLARGQVARCAA